MLNDNQRWKQTTIIIAKPHDWNEYVRYVNQKTIMDSNMAIERHFGIPVSFPCIVFSLLDFSNKFVEHKFVYVDQAIELIRLDSEVNCRLASVASDMENE